ncbi:MAG: TIM barrel protein [Chloroflexi bacterium]|nr:TIM barrel protein [Chloroflexota bacterium]
MKIAIQEDMLAGRTLRERLRLARELGIDGVEFWAEGLSERVPEIAAALIETGMAAAAVNLGRADGFLYPERAARELAVNRLRQAFADAVDLGAQGVTFVPHYGACQQPDLMPFKTPTEIEYELMIWLLRGVEDLADAMGVMLYMQPVNTYETHFMTRLEQAAHFRRQIKDHPYVKIAANVFHMALTETDPLKQLAAHCGDIGYVYVADNNRRLPGQGVLDFAAILRALRDGGYDGWLTLECGTPGTNAAHSSSFAEGLPAALKLLRG